MNDFDDFALNELPSVYNRNSSVSESVAQTYFPNASCRDNNNSSKISQENIGKIIDVANSIVDIKRMKVQSDAVLAKLKEDRLTLLAEAEAYAKKKNADTNDMVQRFALIRDMMKDFYAANTGSMTSEDFRIVITEIVKQMNSK